MHVRRRRNPHAVEIEGASRIADRIAATDGRRPAARRAARPRLDVRIHVCGRRSRSTSLWQASRSLHEAWTLHRSACAGMPSGETAPSQGSERPRSDRRKQRAIAEFKTGAQGHVPTPRCRRSPMSPYGITRATFRLCTASRCPQSPRRGRERQGEPGGHAPKEPSGATRPVRRESRLRRIDRTNAERPPRGQPWHATRAPHRTARRSADGNRRIQDSDARARAKTRRNHASGPARVAITRREHASTRAPQHTSQSREHASTRAREHTPQPREHPSTHVAITRAPQHATQSRDATRSCRRARARVTPAGRRPRRRGLAFRGGGVARIPPGLPHSSRTVGSGHPCRPGARSCSRSCRRPGWPARP